MFSRRQFTQFGLLLAAMPVIQACKVAKENKGASPRPVNTDIFPQGVASADPYPKGVVLWTRINPDYDIISVTLEVSTSPDFSHLYASQELDVRQDHDHTVTVNVSDLDPDTVYFYRFITADGQSSRLGRTRTAPPANSVRPVNFAWASCQDFEAGFYTAWDRMVSEDKETPSEDQIDFVLHVGDFIYETIHAKFTDQDTQALKNWDGYLKDQRGNARKIAELPSGGEPGKYGGRAALTLDDYRHLYRAYLSDPKLQDARARWPFICIWDDHEFVDNGWQSHEGPSANQPRRYAATQAWYEYIPALLSQAPSPYGIKNEAYDLKPVRVDRIDFGGTDAATSNNEPNNQKTIRSIATYRSLQYGQNLHLILTDSRLYRSDHVVPEWWLKAYFSKTRLPKTKTLLDQMDGVIDRPETIQHEGIEAPNPRLGQESATILGAAQKQWWKGSLKASDATWKIWANSIPMTSLRVHRHKSGIADDDAEVLSDDMWSGYPSERRELLKFVRDENIKDVVSFTGDLHVHLAGGASLDDDIIIPEFGVCGISSVSHYRIQRLITPKTSELYEAVFADTGNSVSSYNVFLKKGHFTDAPSLNPFLHYVESNACGYGLAQATRDSLNISLISIKTPLKDLSQSSEFPTVRTKRFNMMRGTKYPVDI